MENRSHTARENEIGVNDTNAISSLWAAAGSGRAVSGSDSTGHQQVTAPLGNPGHRAHTTSSN